MRTKEKAERLAANHNEHNEKRREGMSRTDEEGAKYYRTGTTEGGYQVPPDPNRKPEPPLAPPSADSAIIPLFPKRWMTMDDWYLLFAAIAMEGMLIQKMVESPRELARRAYDLADAMLDERARRTQRTA